MFKYIIKSGNDVKLYESKDGFLKEGTVFPIDGRMWEVISDLYRFRLTLEDLVFSELVEFESDADIDRDINGDGCPLAEEVWSCAARLVDLVEQYKLWLVENH